MQDTAVEIIDLTTSPTLSRKSPIDEPQKRKHSPSEESDGPSSEPAHGTESRRKRKRRERREEAPYLESLEFPAGQPRYFIDTTPVALPGAPLSEKKPTDEEKKLLLPAHVTVVGDISVDILPADLEELEDDHFIDYLDYDDVVDRNNVRYYQEASKKEELTMERTVCKNCGAEGDHKTSACLVQICLTCGARDEHSTRSCPVSKVCFTCGMKGHINANCPNRKSARGSFSSRGVECERCASSRHITNECPTWWRLYEYLTDEVQSITLARRQTKKCLPLGQGGEGYVAAEEWCYNCGNIGHWGDDCRVLRRFQQNEEESAFSLHNVMTGPFYDPKKESQRPGRTEVLEKDRSTRFPNDLPDNVGRKSRMKSRAALEKLAQREDNDPDDWFGNPQQRTNHRDRDRDRGTPRGPRKLTFGKIERGDERYTQPRGQEPPSLLARIGEHVGSETRSHSSRRDNRSKTHEHHGSRHSGHRTRPPDGPRYRGGYSR